MNEPKVILLNADLSSAAGPQLLQGFSGKTYAVSRWYAAYNCHAVEMSVAEYEACRDDLRRGVHLMMRRWFPKFIVPEKAEAVAEFERGYLAGVAGDDLPDGSSRAAQRGWVTAREGEHQDARAGIGPEALSRDRQVGRIGRNAPGAGRRLSPKVGSRARGRGKEAEETSRRQGCGG